jgi:subtilase family serine protease
MSVVTPSVAVLNPLNLGPAQTVTHAVTNPTPAGLTPAQVRSAYGFNLVNFTGPGGQTIQGNGAGQTIAIVDAYADPNIVNDLKVFDAAFGISNNDASGAFALTVHAMSNHVATNAGWDLEIALDVEWAHAIAPGAHIVLVEATSAGINALLSAVDWARSQTGVVAVSMSWGGSEFRGENLYDSHFTTPTGHVGGSNLPGGVTFVASSGDSGAPAGWPAISSNVVAVGGTTLTVDAAGNYQSEVGWSYSGGGISRYEPKPPYQVGVTQSGASRTKPDVAYAADSPTGIAVYDSVPYFGESGWIPVLGTSVGAPQWAALIAIADQGRALAGKGSLDGATQTLPAIYNLPAADFHDITTGNNGYPAGPGYDLVTGRGTPRANLVIKDLVGVSPLVRTASVNGAVATPVLPTGAPVRQVAGVELLDVKAPTRTFDLPNVKPGIAAVSMERAVGGEVFENLPRVLDL